MSGTAQTLFTNTYTIATDDFANPERGFYLHTETRASAPSSVPSNLANLRINGSGDPNNTYIAKVTLVLRVIYLDAFINSPISSNFLNTLHVDLASIRSQGAKAILRFAYFQSRTAPFPSRARRASSNTSGSSRRSCNATAMSSRCSSRASSARGVKATTQMSSRRRARRSPRRIDRSR